MKALRSSLSSLLYYGAKSFGYQDYGTRILCYHRVNDEKSDYLSVSQTQFRVQMEFLKREGYQSIGLGELLNGFVNGKHVVITFDDGYLDNYENAFPIMHQYGFSGTIFCIGNKLGEPSYLSKGQMEEMSKEDFEFGSHTLSHRGLPGLNLLEKGREIIESKSFLENELGREVPFFCYPRGLYDEETIELVKEAGYLGACSNQPGSNDASNGMNPYLLKRTEIASHDSLDDFKKKLAGAYDLMHKALHLVRRRP